MTDIYNYIHGVICSYVRSHLMVNRSKLSGNAAVPTLHVTASENGVLVACMQVIIGDVNCSHDLTGEVPCLCLLYILWNQPLSRHPWQSPNFAAIDRRLHCEE